MTVLLRRQIFMIEQFSLIGKRPLAKTGSDKTRCQCPVAVAVFPSISQPWAYMNYATKPDVVVEDENIPTSHALAKGKDDTNRKTVKIRVPKNVRNTVTDQEENMKKNVDFEEKTSNSKLTEEVFLYIRKSSITVDFNKNVKLTKPIHVRSPRGKETLVIDLDYEEEVEVDNTNPGQNIESINEVLWRDTRLDYKKLPQYYMKLSKIRLTGLVVITTMAGYGIAPDPFSVGTFLLCTVGTALTSCSANAINQYFEVPFDAQMNRTKNRVLVRGHLSPLHAATFAVITGAMGISVLSLGVNSLTACLGAFNLGLYTLVYTPMKRYSIANTWVGSVVGAIPPMMGWTACTGYLDPGAWLLAAILYSWQFPHFNSLSWNLRPDYSRGGYRMASVVRPELCKRVALRHSIGMIPLCTLAPLIDLTSWWFVGYSIPLNVYLSYLAWNFYWKGDSNSSRKLFRFTLVHIPALLVLMIACKKRNNRQNATEHLTLGNVNEDSVS
ncbi:protoheme IX farnesyltransferase, mitochondrial-like [Dreissena polymorpha]|nr:protoheme IX farnesyltransferase, mitochondrial-like [Dreissena polymorpha]